MRLWNYTNLLELQTWMTMSHLPLAVEKKQECHNYKFLIWLSWHRRRRVFVLTVSFWIIFDTTIEHLLFLSHTSYPKHPRNSYFWLLKNPESILWPRPLIIHSLPMWIKSDFTCLERPFTTDCQWDGIQNTLLILWLTMFCCGTGDKFTLLN